MNSPNGFLRRATGQLCHHLLRRCLPGTAECSWSEDPRRGVLLPGRMSSLSQDDPCCHQPRSNFHSRAFLQDRRQQMFKVGHAACRIESGLLEWLTNLSAYSRLLYRIRWALSISFSSLAYIIDSKYIIDIIVLVGLSNYIYGLSLFINIPKQLYI